MRKKPTSHDQNFKNLLTDLPEESLDLFFPKAKKLWGKVKSVDFPRQETKKRRLRDGHLALDMPIMFHFEKETVVLWMVEFQNKKEDFSIHKIGIYTLEMMEEFPDAIVIPTVLFTDSKKWRKDIARTLDVKLGEYNFFHFEYLFVHLAEIKAVDHLKSSNPVARILLPKMHYEKKDRKQIITKAYQGLNILFPKQNLVEKYADFIDIYVEITEDEKEDIVNSLTENKETVMIAQYIKQLGREEGKKEGIEKGIKKGIEKGREEGIEKGKKSRTREIARNLLDILDTKTIALKTGLSLSEVKALQTSKS
jgi:hypothetical protein